MLTVNLESLKIPYACEVATIAAPHKLKVAREQRRLATAGEGFRLVLGAIHLKSVARRLAIHRLFGGLAIDWRLWRLVANRLRAWQRLYKGNFRALEQYISHTHVDFLFTCLRIMRNCK